MVVAVSGSLSGAAGRGGPRDRVAALAHLAGSGAAWSLPSTGVCGSEPARGLADARLGPNGPPGRDLGPQRPLTPHDKAEDTKQPATGGGD